MAFSFNERIPEGKTTLVVDALNLAFRWKHQGRTDFRYECISVSMESQLALTTREFLLDSTTAGPATIGI